MKSTIVGVGIVWAFVMTAVYRTDSDAYRIIRSCNALFLLYLDVDGMVPPPPPCTSEC